jgi:hypothetical protein
MLTTVDGIAGVFVRVCVVRVLPPSLSVIILLLRLISVFHRYGLNGCMRYFIDTQNASVARRDHLLAAHQFSPTTIIIFYLFQLRNAHEGYLFINPSLRSHMYYNRFAYDSTVPFLHLALKYSLLEQHQLGTKDDVDAHQPLGILQGAMYGGFRHPLDFISFQQKRNG